MIPARILDYLKEKGVAYAWRMHPRAVSAQELAHSLHVTGHRVAKTVIVDVDGQTWIAVVPASERIDLLSLAEALGAERVQLVRETDFANRFPECEPGAEPPFGHLYGLPVVVDRDLTCEDAIVMRAGDHENVIELSYRDFASMERPMVASFAIFDDWGVEGYWGAP